MPTKPLEDLFQARVLAWLVKLKLLSPERARLLSSWRHTGSEIRLEAGDRRL